MELSHSISWRTGWNFEMIWLINFIWVIFVGNGCFKEWNNFCTCLEYFCWRSPSWQRASDVSACVAPGFDFRGETRKLLQWVVTLNTAVAWQKACYLYFTKGRAFLPCIMDRFKAPAVISQRKRQKGLHSPKLSCSYEIKFSNFVIFIMQRKMGVTRRMFLMELGRRKGFRVESELR